MSEQRVVVVLLALAAGAVLLGLFELYRRWRVPDVDRLDIDALGLTLMTGCCAFVVFTTASCRPCKAALTVIDKAMATSAAATELITVDAVERHELAIRYEVRTIPTIFLITASGRVVERWRKVPEISEVARTLASI